MGKRKKNYCLNRSKAEVHPKMQNTMEKQTKKTFTWLSIFILVGLMVRFGVVQIILDYDSVAWAVHKKVGNKVHYEGKKREEENEVLYVYLLQDSQDENLLAEMVDAVNEKLEKKDAQKKVGLIIREEIAGGEIPVVFLYNHYNNSIRPHIYYMEIRGSDVDVYSSYNQASSYTTLEGIEYLRVIDKVNKSAEEEGIDWYGVFPDLKGYEVYAGRVNGRYSGEIIYQEMKEE